MEKRPKEDKNLKNTGKKQKNQEKGNTFSCDLEEFLKQFLKTSDFSQLFMPFRNKYI